MSNLTPNVKEPKKSDALEYYTRAALLDVRKTINPKNDYSKEEVEVETLKLGLVTLTGDALIKVKLDALEALIDGLSQDEILSAVKLFEYMGFDPIKMRSQIAQKADANDLFFVLTLVSTRGTNASKLKIKTNPDSLKKFDKVVKNLDIDVTKKGSNIASDVVTLGRVAACFPEIIARIYKKGKISNKFGYSGDLANYLMFPQAPSIMDKEEDYNKWKEWNEKFTKTINPPKKKKKSKKTDEEEEEENEPTDYGLIIYQSKLFSESDRRRIMDKLRSEEKSSKDKIVPDVKIPDKPAEVAPDLKDPRFEKKDGETAEEMEVRISDLMDDEKSSTDIVFFKELINLFAKELEAPEQSKSLIDNCTLARTYLLKELTFPVNLKIIMELARMIENKEEPEVLTIVKDFVDGLNLSA